MTGWAVSYSDLLMVLLAFFVLYFRFGEQESSSILNNVVRQLDSQAAARLANAQSAGAVSQNAAAGDTVASAPSLSAKQLRTAIETAGLKIEESALKGSLTIHFSDQFFAPGQYQLTLKQNEKLQQLLSLLEPYRSQIDLVFIGHTDTSAIATGRKKVVDSNLVLSNLRAARAAEFALLKGFDPQHVSSEGVGQYRRATRSLSVKIVERKSL